MKWKKYAAQAGILAAVFVAAVIIFSHITNRGNGDLTADMGAAKRPQVSFSYNGYAVNVLSAYRREMDIPAMRDTVTPVTDGTLDMVIRPYENVIESLTYTVYTLDGTGKLSETTVKKPGENVELSFETEGLLDEERVLELVLHMEGGEKAYMYTRIVDAGGKNALECLDYINDFHKNALNKVEDAGIGTAIEPNEEGDNSTFNHVTIHSNFDQVTYGALEPKVEGNESWSICEMNSTYTSLRIEYLVRCTGEENEGDTYRVSEFFRVRHIPQGQRTYLLDYDRTMDQIFDASGHVLSETGVVLGIADRQVPYLVNGDGTSVSFVQARELWNYNKDTDEVSLVFSFADAENADLRNELSHHEIRLLEMDDAGNTTFAVYGYMNRGDHEGEVGIAVYYYDIEQNSVEEKAFVSSDRSWERVVRELGKLVYYSVERDVLYMMADGVLYEIDVSSQNMKELASGLSERQYVVSDDGRVIAYHTGDSAAEAGEIVVKNLATGKERTEKCGEGESILPLGFIKNDFVYGTARSGDIGQTMAGQEVIPMYRVDITNNKGETVKTYEQEGVYVLGAEFESNRIILRRAVRDGNAYTETGEDYITNNEEEKESNIYAESYVTELKKTQMRLVYADGISDREPKLLKPKQVKNGGTDTVAFEETDAGRRYYVYGFGGLQGIYDSAGRAIREADAYSGVVVSERQTYIWVRGNRDLKHSIPEEQAGEVESIRAGLSAGRTPVEVMDELSGGRSIDLTGCTAEQLLYIVDQDIPVIAVTDGGGSVILTGYGESTVTYVNAADGAQVTVSQEDMDNMTAGSGHTYVACERP